MKKFVNILLILLSFQGFTQTFDAFLVSEKGVKLSSVKVDVYENGKRSSYFYNSSKKSLYLDVGAKYKFSKAGYYPETYYVSKSDYDNNFEDYENAINITLRKYVDVNHTIVSESGRPIYGVKIECKKLGYKSATDESGNYKLPGNANGSSVFVFEKTGYYKEEILFSKINGKKELVLYHQSNDKTKILGKVVFDDGKVVKNTPVYLFDSRLKKLENVSQTNDKGYFQYYHTHKNEDEKICIALADGRSGTTNIRKNVFQQKLKIVVASKVSSTKKITQLNQKPKNASLRVEKKEAPETKLSRVDKNLKEEEKIGLPEVTKVAIQEQILEDSLDVVVEEHVDTAKTGKEEELVQIEDYISYLEILLEENDIDYGKSYNITTKESSIKKEGVKKEFQSLTEVSEIKEVELAKEEEKNQYLGFLIGGLVLILIPIIVLIFAYITYRKTQKFNMELNLINKNLTSTYERIKTNINYAKRIQRAVLVNPNVINNHFTDSFLFYRPRDVVSGDFYWFSKVGGKTILSAIDCTGHGIPGAFMTMLGNSFLNEIVNIQKVTNPKEILEQLNEKIKSTLSQGESKLNDGMDLSIISIDEKSDKMLFAGANNPIFVVEDDKLLEIKPSKRAVGGQDRVSRSGKVRKQAPFVESEIDISNVSSVYLFSDGYQDQFGGAEEEKFMKSTFRDLIDNNKIESFETQLNILTNRIDGWRGNLEQTDDMLVIGVKL